MVEFFFFVQESKQQKKTPSHQQVQDSLDEILRDLENQAGNIKKFPPNWQQITKTSKILETVQRAKIPFCTIPPSTLKNNPTFTQPEIDAR